MSNRKVIEIKGLSKYFGPVKAIQNVNLNVYEGEIMALVGENGAGKSTIIKCLGGVYVPENGTIKVFNIQQNFKNTKESMKAGIAIVHQELKLMENLSIAENIFLGRLFTKWGKIDYKKLYLEAEYYLNILGLNINSKTLVSKLTIAEQQMVEIAKALSLKSKIIVLDEPTDTLSAKEVNVLFTVIKKLQQQKISFLYVTHRMKEIQKICDRYTVFKDGAFVAEGVVKNANIESIIELMIGRNLSNQFPQRNNTIGQEYFRAEHVSNQYVRDISLKTNQGEILGLAGLIGSGRTEFAKSLIGLIKMQEGHLYIEGKETKIKNINQAIKHEIYYVSENRKFDGLNVEGSIRDNMVASSLNQMLTKFKIINYKTIKKMVQQKKASMSIKFHHQKDLVSSLSGGNQQKILLAKALMTNPKLLILDEPTRGVDVGSRKEIYVIMNKICQSGTSIIMISSDLPEIIGMSDRVIVFHEGQLSGELNKHKISEINIMNLAMGISKQRREN